MLPLRTLNFIAAAGFAASLASIAPASAQITQWRAELKGADEVPPTSVKGTGNVDATLDTATHKLTWTVTYVGLTGPVTAAHFHGPAEAGKNAPPVVPLSGAMASPIKGEATLTPAQQKDFEDGKVYFNLHTAEHKDGEIRGQIVKK